MSKLILELVRTDFIPSEWTLYDKGIKFLSKVMLKKDQQFQFNRADEVYVILGKDKHYLKRK
jgi:hypothetical protein